MCILDIPADFVLTPDDSAQNHPGLFFTFDYDEKESPLF